MTTKQTNIRRRVATASGGIGCARQRLPLSWIALLGVGGYDVRQVSTASERLSAVVQTEHDDQAYFRDLDKRVVLLQEEVDYPHLHGAACLCRGVIGGKQETMRITLGADCDARMIADLEKAFPVSCRRDE